MMQRMWMGWDGLRVGMGLRVHGPGVGYKMRCECCLSFIIIPLLRSSPALQLPQHRRLLLRHTLDLSSLVPPSSPIACSPSLSVTADPAFDAICSLPPFLSSHSSVPLLSILLSSSTSRGPPPTSALLRSRAKRRALFHSMSRGSRFWLCMLRVEF